MRIARATNAAANSATTARARTDEPPSARGGVAGACLP
jgi:hypothetical protein